MTTSLPDLGDLTRLVRGMTPEQIEEIVDTLPQAAVERLVTMKEGPTVMPPNPAEQAAAIDAKYQIRPHTAYLAERIAKAVTDVENGESRMLRVTMPPRMGKSTLCSLYTPIWLLRKHPDWKIGMISHDGDFATTWGRNVRRYLDNDPTLGVKLAKDAGAAAEWETSEKGGVLARSVGGSITGRGFKVLLLDDVVKDFATAHHELSRQRIWDWWLAVAQTRMEPPYLIISIGTRWHEDDFLGRLTSHDYEGDPEDWELIDFPAVAEVHDVLGRAPGEPLLSPLIDEDNETALERWAKIKRNVGTYTWAALYQQTPAPVEGAIFEVGWWRYWTSNPHKADGDRVVYWDPEDPANATGRWLDSWDMAFKGGDTNDFVVAQRWCRVGPRRYLVAQLRGRLTFTQTLSAMRHWTGSQPEPGDPDWRPVDLPKGIQPFLSPPCLRFVHRRLVEDKANGSAVIDTLGRTISGVVPVNPTNSKEGRARSVTPEVESGHVYLPLPSDPGNEWVNDLLGELRAFPNDANDDQADALTQALTDLRDTGDGHIVNPATRTPPAVLTRRINRTAQGPGTMRRYGNSPGGR